MAIWPFGRKNKRHTIQLGDETADSPSIVAPQPLVPESISSLPPEVEPRLTRKKSKRQKNRHSQPVIHDPSSLSSLHDVVATRSASSHPIPPPGTAHSENKHRRRHHSSHPQLRKGPGAPSSSAPKNSRFDDYLYPTDSTVGRQHQPNMSRSISVKGKRNDNGHAVLKKRLSQRKMNKIAREQEIRLMSSCPIDIPGRHPGDHLSVGPVKRGPPRARGSRRLDRHHSDTNLSVRNSIASSQSDNSDSHTFKVNALAAFTPRPLIRYVDAPRLPTSRSQNASVASTRPAVGTVSEEELSKRRVERLADDLDAGGLRELLERDRRRREQKDIKDQNRAQRKLERSAERQRIAARRTEKAVTVPSATAATAATATAAAAAAVPSPEPQEGQAEASSRSRPKSYDDGDDESQRPQPMVDGPLRLPGSWLRDSSRERPLSLRESVDSAQVIGNIDDSSIREPPKLGQRPSFAQSHDMGVSRTTLSPSQSPSRHGVGSPASSQIYGMARESMSDASRMSDHSGGPRVNTFSSLFRRGSSRLKRSYRERFHDQPSDVSNASHVSHESFSKIPTQSTGPALSIPQRTYPRSTGTVKRSHSKFTEHFGDEPLSPPDSRLQSPDIAEEPAERSGIPIGTAYPIPGSDPDLPAARRNRHRSWMTDSVDAESENVPLSQSLASIDSEGSWMSGHFLRRISNRRLRQPMRNSTGQFEQGSEEVSPIGDAGSGGAPFVRFSSTNDEEPTSAEAINEPEPEPPQPDVPRLSDEDPAETWHTEVGKRPVLVNPTMRPKSTEGLLKNIQTLSPVSASAEVEFSPIEEHSAELDYATDEDQPSHIS